VNPRSYDKLGELAIYEAQSSNFKQATHDLQQALSLAPKDVQLIYNAALVYHWPASGPKLSIISSAPSAMDIPSRRSVLILNGTL
jgi:hypothetical protein